MAVVSKCDVRSDVFLAHYIHESDVDMTVLFRGKIRKIEIAYTTIKTIFIDKKITKNFFDFIMFKENPRLRLTKKNFGTVKVVTVLFRIRALNYLDPGILSEIDTLQFFSMNSTNFNLGNQQNIWTGKTFKNLEIRGPHTTFSIIEGCLSLSYVEFGIIWTSGPANVIPNGFLKNSTLLETIYIHRAQNFVLPNHFMPELRTTKDINLTVNIWNVNFMSLSNRINVLNDMRLNASHRELLNGFDNQEAKYCNMFCNCLPNGWGACGHCDDDWEKQNCGICVKNLLRTENDIPRQLRGTCFLDNSEVISNIKMPPPHPTWAPGDYQPNMGNDYEGVTRRRALVFYTKAQVGLILLLVIILFFSRRFNFYNF